MINKLLIFDLDGTIIDVYGCGRKAINTTMKRMYGIYGTGEKLSFSSTDYGVLLDLAIKLNLKGIFFKRIEEFYVIYSEELEKEIEQNNRSRLMPGFPEILEYFENKTQFHLAIATGNMRVGAITKMAYFGLEKYFPTGGFGGNLLNKKDVILSGFKNAKNYYKNNFKKGDVFVIGDTAKDIIASKDLGFNSIAVTTGFEGEDKLIQSEPDWIFTNLSNIEEFTNVVNSCESNLL